jgi:hypothetical protein
MRFTMLRVFACVMAFLAVGGGSRLTAQTLQKQVNVTLPQRVVVAEKTLEPGDYSFREVSDRLVQVFDKDKMQAEAAVATIDTENKEPAKETKLVLYKFGDSNEYYIDKMWIQGRSIGYEFPMPERFKDLKREREESIAGKYEEKELKEGLK